MTLNQEAKKTLLRKIPHGLFICTVRDGEQVNGFTASWVTQGSFSPPLVVIGVRSEGSSHETIKKTKKFALNFLRADQKDLAAVFFKPQQGLGGRFDSAPFSYGDLGLPLLADCIGGVECELAGSVENGDHTIFVGEVKSANLIKDSEALNLSSTGWSYGG
tara:strand:- start:3155 stop:3637 length:483 start_codon:yes stop_codon:yes gene_type:complete